MNPSSRSPPEHRSNPAAVGGRVAAFAKSVSTVNTETVSNGRCVHSHTLSPYTTLAFQLSISSISTNPGIGRVPQKWAENVTAFLYSIKRVEDFRFVQF